MWPAVTFALLVLRHPVDPAKYALVHEGRRRGHWLPGGGVDDGETPVQGACREAAEEANADVDPATVQFLRLEQTPQRARWIFAARARSDVLKSKPDAESNGARWVTLEQTREVATGRAVQTLGLPAADCRLRGGEPLQWFQYLDEGGPAFALGEFTDLKAEVGASHEDKRAVYKTSVEARLCVVSQKQGVWGTLTSRGLSLPRVSAASPDECLPALALKLAQGEHVAAPHAVALVFHHARANGTASLGATFVCHHADGDTKPPTSKGKWCTSASEFSDELDRRVVERMLSASASARLMPLSVVVDTED